VTGRPTRPPHLVVAGRQQAYSAFLHGIVRDHRGPRRVGGTAGGATDGNSTAHGSRTENCADPCTVTADPDITEVAGSFTVSYLVKVVLRFAAPIRRARHCELLPFTCSDLFMLR